MIDLTASLDTNRMNRNNSNKINVSRKKQKKNKAQLNDGVSALPNTAVTFSKTIDQVFPDRLNCTLKLISSGRTIVNTGVQATGFRLRPTSAFDPTIGGGLTPVGFAPISAIYGSYRVSSSTYLLECANTSTTAGMSVYLAPLNADPGSSPSPATIISYANQTYGQVKLMPPTGGPAVKIQRTMSTERIFGSKAVYFDDNFSAAINATPTNNWFWAVGFAQDVISPPSPATATWTQELWLTIEFFNRRRIDL